MVISFDLKRAFNKDTMIIPEETICKLGRGKLPQLDKEHLKKLYLISDFIVKHWICFFSPKVRNKANCPLSLLFNIILATALREEKKRYTDQEGRIKTLLADNLIVYIESSEKSPVTGSNKQVWTGYRYL